MHSKLAGVFIAVALMVVATVGATALLNAQSNNATSKDKKELKGSGSSDNGKSASKPATTTTTSAPTTSTTVRSTTTTTKAPKKNDDNKNNGNGNGESHKDFTISGSVPSLYPGATKQLVLTVSNPNNFAIKVTSLKVTTAGASTPGCTASSVVTDSLATPLVVDKDGTATTNVAIRMASDTPNACQGATFTLVYSGIGEKA